MYSIKLLFTLLGWLFTGPWLDFCFGVCGNILLINVMIIASLFMSHFRANFRVFYFQARPMKMTPKEWNSFGCNVEMPCIL